MFKPALGIHGAAWLPQAIAMVVFVFTHLVVTVRPVSAGDTELCDRGTVDDSIAACSRLIASGKLKDRDLANRYYVRGNSYSHKNDYDRAIADYNEAIALNSKNAYVFNNRGLAYFNKDDDDRAIADYNEAIRLDPKYTGTFINRGNLYKKRSDYDRAIVDYNEAIRIYPKNAFAFNNRGETYRIKGDYNRAIADFNQALRLYPKFPSAHTHRGLAYEGVGDRERAKSDFYATLAIEEGAGTGSWARDKAGERLAAIAAPPPQIATAPPPASSVAPASATAPPPGTERRVALVIGNSEYRSAAFLPNPRRDASAVAAALREIGFTVVKVATDLDRGAMVAALRAFRDEADRADWALIYFAGHGIEIERANYLIPTDARLQDERDIKAETISYAEVEATVGGARALRLVVLDACRVNPFKDRMRRIAASRSATDRGLAPPPEPKPGTVIVYSAKDGEVAADDVGGANSPFALAFMKEIRVPGREMRRLFDYVRDDVLEATNQRQQPFTYQSLPSRQDFFFVAEK